MKIKVISFVTALVVLVLILANIPPIAAFTPTTGLDPAEVTVSVGAWSFSYGKRTAYGCYIRDVQWDSVTNTDPDVLEQYIGMASVTWANINGYEYTLPRGNRSMQHTLVAIDWWQVKFSNGFTSLDPSNPPNSRFWLNITYDLVDQPFWSPNYDGQGSPDATINITVTLETPSSVTVSLLRIRCRIDFDICGLSTPGDDKIFVYDDTPAWQQQNTETTYSAEGYSSPTYNMVIKQEDANISGPWAGIKPETFDDVHHILKFNNAEYTGNPINYVNQEYIYGQDIVYWWENDPENTKTYGSFAIWMQ